MSTPVAATGQTCPNCGHRNSPGAAFCAECGTRLDASTTDTQATTAFSPVQAPDTESGDPAATWRAPDDPYTTQEFTPETPVATTTTEHGSRASADWYPTPVVVRRTAPESRRGFVLGIIAAILILLMFGFYAWSTLASEGFRDSVTGIFS
jgi:DNA-directed RNA polymerase subunit RPC12/RpoP